MSNVTDLNEYKSGRTLKDFVMIPKKLIGDESVKASSKVVYAALASYTNNTTGLCSPALSTLAKDTGYHRRTIIRAINELVEKEYVEKRTRKSSNSDKNISNVYKLF